MSRILSLVILLCTVFIVSSCVKKDGPPYPPADGAPSPAAENMRGAMGTMTFVPNDWTDQDSYWKDSDGVDPDAAGCHIGTDAQGTPNGRMFGEVCLSDVVLVESNPGANELHKHKNDVGHPDIIHCNAWCLGKDTAGGQCSVVTGPAPCSASAVCACLF